MGSGDCSVHALNCLNFASRSGEILGGFRESSRDRHGVSSDWQGIARVIDSLGRDDFEQALFCWVASFARIAVIFAIEINDVTGEGRVLVTEGRTENITQRARKISREYADTDYVTDDVYCKSAAKAPGHIDVLVQSASDREGEFRLKYFDNVGTSEEISVFERDAWGTFYLGFSSTKSGYSGQEILLIRSAVPLVISLIRRHTGILANKGCRHEPIDRRMASIRASLLEHKARLTEREADVCSAIVVGYRAEAIGYRLGISPNTVATHRKRAYRKLCISSQTELFRIFFDND